MRRNNKKSMASTEQNVITESTESSKENPHVLTEPSNGEKQCFATNLTNCLKNAVSADKSGFLSSADNLYETWTEDFESMSKYTDKKSFTIAWNNNYLAEHPEIKEIVSDYIQALLIVKPVDVIEFTRQHMRTFAVNPESSDEAN